MNKDMIFGLIPGGVLLLVFIIAMIVSFWPRKRKPKFWVEFDENGNLMF